MQLLCVLRKQMLFGLKQQHSGFFLENSWTTAMSHILDTMAERLCNMCLMLWEALTLSKIQLNSFGE